MDQQQVFSNEKEWQFRVAALEEQISQQSLALAEKDRELEISKSLARVRAVTMAMNNSSELNIVINVVYEEIVKLDPQLDRCIIFTIDPVTRTSLWWMASGEDIPFQSGLFIDYHEHEPYLSCLNAFDKQTERWSYLLEGETKKDWDAYLFEYSGLRSLPEIVRRNMMSFDRIYLFGSFSDFGCLSSGSVEPLGEDSMEMLVRFTKEFNLTYRRFLDFKQLERQAREAMIETALEKVRSRSLAMHHSDELPQVAAIVFEKLTELKFTVDDGAVGILIFEKGSKEHQQWIADPEHIYPFRFHIPYSDHQMCRELIEGWENEIGFSSKIYSFEVKNEYMQYLFTHSEMGLIPEDVKKHILSSKEYGVSIAYEKNTGILIPTNSGRLVAGDQVEVLKRFSRVFEQAYIRFRDLQKAETQAYEAQIETALERVRSRTLAMQHSGELAETAGVLFRQLNSLHIGPNRLYICVFNEEKNEIEFWLTDDEGINITSKFAGKTDRNDTIRKMYEGWKKELRSLIVEMNDEELEKYFRYFGNELHVPSRFAQAHRKRFQNIAYFSKGFVGMASPEEQPASTLQLMERFAYVFNLTYTRFSDLKLAEAHAVQAAEDLVKLQAEKKRAEEALLELRATQKQLVHAEKMASLGELTAGIAHEIQNPLNFVNNFSEVNKEMLAELEEEIKKGSLDNAKAIAADLILNEEKINFHGRRADAIVKGMLEHSRTGGSEKEAYDINALTHENLFFCYHALKARDKSFNAAIETHFDPSIGLMHITPKDLSRAILNIVNNAFYAVNQKSQGNELRYEPKVVVTTIRYNSHVEISVRDNGDGIPEKVMDKVFQPFFTTKPPGQGTGLGLSLAYDIVKVHGGEIRVNNHPGAGAEFVIVLPLNSN
ncbi:sensor histidine kinase [Pollutibacter soli]|uniref:sensor histidine kinase n=1 Tax=Pollutibacter soli TaxID=3034157 RepID=UPI00301350A6